CWRSRLPVSGGPGVGGVRRHAGANAHRRPGTARASVWGCSGGRCCTGADTASNALFGSLQRITAEQLKLDPILIVATNSTGGVMGKMIDAQSITVATAACYEDPREGAHALGPIFRTVFWHSIVLAAFIGLIVMLQAYVFPWMVP